MGGNATERALLSFLSSNPDTDYKVINEILFNSKRKFSAVEVAIPRDMARKMPITVVNNNMTISLYKGAPEIILENTSHYIAYSWRRSTT